MHGNCLNPRQLKITFRKVTKDHVRRLLLAQRIEALRYPVGQSPSCAWALQIVFDNGDQLEFSSEAVWTGGWGEIGILCISDAAKLDNESVDWRYAYAALEVATDVEILTFSGASFRAQVGLELRDETGKPTLQIACAPAPGAVSLGSASFDSILDPEVCVEDLSRIPM